MVYISRKAILLGLSIGLTSLAGLYLVSETFAPLTPDRMVQQRQRKKPTRIATETSSITQAPVAQNSSIAAPAEGAQASPTSKPDLTIMQVCEPSWRILASTREADLQNDLRKKLLILSQDCLQRMSVQAKATAIKDFVINCQLQLQTKNSDFIENSCLTHLASFRSFVIRSLGDRNLDLASLETTDLANQLMGGMIDLRQASESEIQRNIEIANALIAKDPNFYPAYKAKLINHLIEELKFGRPQSSDVYQDLYEELLSFRENPNGDLNGLETYGDSTAAQASSELSGMDTDLIHIPFLRLSAMKDVNGLANMAQDYIAAYPNSYVGYMYLADASWKSGDTNSAIGIIQNSLGPNATSEMALETLRRFQSQDPVERIIQMGRAF